MRKSTVRQFLSSPYCPQIHPLVAMISSGGFRLRKDPEEQQVIENFYTSSKEQRR
jgi:hypothetical protein